VAVDVLEPGPDGDYPAFPRNAQGTPLWSDDAPHDGVPVDGVMPVPRGWRVRDGVWTNVDPRLSEGTPVEPPPRTPAA
jgi:hypothetical protein